MEDVFAGLDPAWKPIALSINQDLEAQGVKCVAFCGRRSFRDQRDAFKRGASKCDGLENISLHQAGLAMDWVAIDKKGNPSWDYRKYENTYKAIRNTIVAHGGEAGGSWYKGSQLDDIGLGWDPPHGQLKA